MNNTILTATVTNIETAIRGGADKMAGLATHTKDAKQAFEFIARLTVDCILNNLCLDHMTGAELLLYLKTFASVYAPTEWAFFGSGSINEVEHEQPALAKPMIQLPDPHEFMKKINRLWVRNAEARAA